MPPRDCRFDHLSWPAAAAAMQQPGATVVWPFGACEQHGPQLPLATDALFAERILDAVLLGLDPLLPIWRLPVQAIGFSPEHASFPGTLSLPADLLIALVEKDKVMAEAADRASRAQNMLKKQEQDAG